MNLFNSLLVLGLVCMGGAVACGGSDHGDGTQGADLSQLTPEQICQKKCDLQATPQCERIPSDYRTSCTLLCQSKYSKNPNCSAQAHALDACSIQRVSYSCGDTGNLVVTPEGACANEGLACISCAGSLYGCL